MEQFILSAISLASLASLFYIPKTKYRLAFISFLAFEATTWASINILVQTGEISFPVRVIFTRATQVGFVQNFMFFPMIYAWFMLLYQKKATIAGKILHYIIFVSVVVWFIYFFSIYTELEDFLKGSVCSQMVRLYISFLIQFLLCRIYINWLSKKTNVLTGM
jgi:hypothetical protein